MEIKKITFDDLVDYGAQQALRMFDYHSNDPDDDGSISAEAAHKMGAAIEILADFYFGGNYERANNLVQTRRYALKAWQSSLFESTDSTQGKGASIPEDTRKERKDPFKGTAYGAMLEREKAMRAAHVKTTDTDENGEIPFM